MLQPIKKIVLMVVLMLGIAAIVAYMRSPVDAVVWTPTENPGLTGAFAANERLSSLRAFAPGIGHGPEDIAIDASGTIYSGYENGDIARIDANDGSYRVIANTGGRPLGLAIGVSGELIVADAYRGLLSVDSAGLVSVLADEIDGQPIRFADGVDVAADGTIWFSDASDRHGYENYLLIFFEARANGRLLRYSPATQSVDVMLDGLLFANGVALSADERYVLVNETVVGRIRRLWLTGPREGQVDVFADALPGTPDNIKRDAEGRFWVGLPALRDAGFERMAGMPWLRQLLAGLPAGTRVPPNDRAFVVVFNDNGSIAQTLQHAPSDYRFATGALPFAGRLYVTSLTADAIGVMPAP